MAARGTEEKQIVLDKIMEMFPSAFIFGKELRVPVGDVQIKVALTCAKDNVSVSGGPAIPEGDFPTVGTEAPAPALAKPTQEELDNVNKLCEVLGL